MGLLGLAGLFPAVIILTGLFREEMSFLIVGLPVTALLFVGEAFLWFYAYTGGGIEVTSKVIRVDKFCFGELGLCRLEVSREDVTRWGFHEYIWGRLVLVSTKPPSQSLNVHYEYYQHPEQLKKELTAFLGEEKRAC